MAFKGEAWRVPSDAVCSDSRKSKPLPWAMFICRCNASTAGCQTTREYPTLGHTYTQSHRTAIQQEQHACKTIHLS